MVTGLTATWSERVLSLESLLGMVKVFTLDLSKFCKLFSYLYTVLIFSGDFFNQ